MTRKATGPLADPTPLPVDRLVAVAAWRYVSRSRGPRLTHDVALLLAEDGPAWDCTCESATLGEGQLDRDGLCIHAADARRRWVASGHHDWTRRPRVPYPFCASCGAVRQADGRLDAAPCRRAGDPVRVRPREAR